MSGTPEREKIRRPSILTFFRKPDDWLLINHPFIWRTRIHYFLLSCFLFVLPLSLLMSAKYSISIQDFPSANELRNDFLWPTFLVGAAVLLYWISRIRRRPVHIWNIGRSLLSWIMYTLCVFCFIICSLAGFPSLVIRIADLDMDQTFEESYLLHSENNYWCCAPDHPGTPAAYKEAEVKIRRDLRRFGLLGPDQRLYGPGEWNCNCQKKECCLFVLDAKTNINLSIPLREHLAKIRAAKLWKYEGAGAYAKMFDWRFILWVACGLGFLIWLMEQVERISAIEIGLIRGRRSRKKRSLPKRWVTAKGPLSKMETFLLTRLPVFWTTKIHHFAIYALLIFLLYRLCVKLSDYLVGQGYGTSISNTSYLNIAFATVTVLAIFTWGYRLQSNKYIPAKISRHVDMIVIWLVGLTLIPGALVMLETTLSFDTITLHPSEESFWIIILIFYVIAIPLVSWGYTSRLHPERHRSDMYIVNYLLYFVGLGSYLLYFGLSGWAVLILNLALVYVLMLAFASGASGFFRLCAMLYLMSCCLLPVEFVIFAREEAPSWWRILLYLLSLYLLFPTLKLFLRFKFEPRRI